ncbi:hypothetical protein [Halobaculum sp. D14]|uniref:hypothetical protein n=1 Tax=Halobaculum sp. D14 TaxID=3421642 RepID=UPI003EB9A661
MSNSDSQLKCKIVETLIRKRKTGSNKIRIDTLLNYSVRDSDAGRARQLINDEMIPRNEASLVQVGGGQRKNVKLGSIDEAVEFLKEHGGDVPWGFD